MILEKHPVPKSHIFLQSDLWEASVSNAFSRHESVHPSTTEPLLSLRSLGIRGSQEVLLSDYNNNV